MERVTGNVFASTDLRGCNPGYVATSEGVVVIDTPQLPSKAVAMREEVLNKGALRFLINTEHHIDHIFGNLFFAGMGCGVGHEAILENFWTSVRNVDPYQYMLEVVEKDDPPGLGLMSAGKGVKVNPPSITFSERLNLQVGDHRFELIYTPGHTKGQITVFIPKEKVAFVGDNIFCECQTWFHSSDPDAWLRSLDFLNTLDVEYIVPGHGPVCKKDYIPKQSAFIREWVAAVAVGIAKGWSKEESLERISFLDRFPMDVGQESSGPMVQRLNVERIYDFLLGKAERFQ